jgi:hypothetical protein
MLFLMALRCVKRHVAHVAERVKANSSAELTVEAARIDECE